MFLSLVMFSNANTNFILPPDSSVRLIDRAASIILIDEGKQLLNQGKTRDALTRFRQAQIKDQYSYRAAFWVGRAHYNLSNFGYALKYALKAQELSSELNGEICFLLGESYHRKNSLDSAAMYYEKASTRLSRSKMRVYRVQKLMDDLAYADSLSKIEKKYNKNLTSGEVNSGFDDYSPILVPEMNKLYFVSRRPDTEGGELNPEDQRYFEDIYRAKWNDETQEWDSITNDLGRINSKGFDAVGHIADEGRRMYMTVNTSIIDIKNNTHGSDICISEMNRLNNWSTPKPIKNKTINTSYFDGAPTLTEDENTMYFVSDRRGEHHMSDIYVVHKDGRKWGTAVPLPDNVNTPFNETTPFITPDGKYLFYSSEGFRGMGGYDVYVTENLGDGKWSDPVNIGHEFNTVNNDTHFKYYEGVDKVFLASYLLQGKKASINIFDLDVKGWEIPIPKREEQKEVSIESTN